MASHGSKAVLRVGTAAAPTPAATEISDYGNSVSASFSRDSSEVTTFALGSKQYIPGLKDATIPFEGPFSSELDAVMWPLFDQGTIVDFQYEPAGPGAGNIRYSGRFFITSYEVSSDVGGPNGTSGEFQVTGDVTREVLA